MVRHRRRVRDHGRSGVEVSSIRVSGPGRPAAATTARRDNVQQEAARRHKEVDAQDPGRQKG